MSNKDLAIKFYNQGGGNPQSKSIAVSNIEIINQLENILPILNAEFTILRNEIFDLKLEQQRTNELLSKMIKILEDK